MLRIVQFAAIVLAALALVPAGAHLFELPGKIALGRDAYLATQGIYAGWALFAVAYFGALVGSAVLVFMLRWTAARLCAGLAALGFAAFFAVFFTWTYPANRITANWTTLPEDWERLRAQWEYSHAANAGIVFAAFVALVLSALLSER